MNIIIADVTNLLGFQSDCFMDPLNRISFKSYEVNYEKIGKHYFMPILLAFIHVY